MAAESAATAVRDRPHVTSHDRPMQSKVTSFPVREVSHVRVSTWRTRERESCALYSLSLTRSLITENRSTSVANKYFKLEESVKIVR